jgi:hypothetical protein
MTVNQEVIIGIIAVLLDSAAAWFFCCVMSVYVLPLIIDRAIFYIPKMISLYRTGEVFLKGTIFSVLEMFLWLAIIVGSYLYLYFFQRHLFILTTTSVAAYIAWLITIIHLIYRFVNFDRVIKRGFYYVAYMRHIKPEALRKYQSFIEDLDDLSLEEIEKILKTGLPYMYNHADEIGNTLKTGLPYMYRQAALRKFRELSLK